jgi:hypothetical protein
VPASALKVAHEALGDDVSHEHVRVILCFRPSNRSEDAIASARSRGSAGRELLVGAHAAETTKAVRTF